MPPKKAFTEELGHAFGRPDTERLGLFSEMPYMNGKGYVSPFPKPALVKGKNIIGEGPKLKTGKTDYLFDKEFKRLFEGEAIKGRGRKPKPSPFKNISEKPFNSPGNLKPISTPGDYYGTFQGQVEEFSPKKRPQPPFKHEIRNIITSPGKKGGFGYVNICINPYPNHSVERYGLKLKYKEYGKILNGPLVTAHHTNDYFEPNPFHDPPNIKPGPTYVRPKEVAKPFLAGNLMPAGPGKLLGGCKAGGFNKFPEYKPNKYITSTDLEKPKKHVGGNFFPQSTAEKTLYTTSIISENVRFRVNAVTRNKYEANYVKYLLD